MGDTHLRQPVRHVVVEENGVTGYVEVIDSFVPRGMGQLIDHFRLNTAKKILLRRGGNIGDVIMMTPLIRQLHEEYPHLEIHVATQRAFIPLLETIEYITVHDNSNLRTDNMRLLKPMYDEIVELGAFVERSPRQFEVDRISLFGEACGLRIKNGSPLYRIKPQEQEWAKEWISTYCDPTLPILGLAPFATDVRRSWPGEYVQELAKLVSEEMQLLWFHPTKGMRLIFDGIPNVAYADTLSIREVAALLPHCNSLLSADTGMYHLAAAVQRKQPGMMLATPFLFVLFGQWPPWTRMKWYTNYLSFYPEHLECVPCYATAQSFKCRIECMKKIRPKEVWEQIKENRPIPLPQEETK